MSSKAIVIGMVLTLALGGGIGYRLATSGGAGHAEHHEGAGHEGETKAQEKEHGAGKEHGEGKEHGAHDEHDEHGAEGTVAMTRELQQQNGVVLAAARKERLAGVISATGKVEANADRIAHVSPRISGKIVSVRGALGDSVGAGQTLATLDSVELADSLSRYHQSRTKLELARSNMERIKALVEKKIAARKDILLAETEFKNAETELHTDEDRLALYGVSVAELRKASHRKALLPVVSPIGGIITEKHAIVGELADPAKSLYTVADLSSVWVVVDINEKDLAKVHRGQGATVAVTAFPDLKLKGRITYIADQVDQSSRTVKARIEVANPGRKLKPEMFATAQVLLAGDAASVLAVPEEALQDLDGRKVVFVAESPASFAARPVQTGRSAGGMVEILSGLKEGESYAAKGAFVLKSELKKGEMTDEHGHGG